MPKNEESNIIIDEISTNADKISIVLQKTMNQYLSTIKATSVLDSRYSVAKAGIKKDINTYASKIFLCNILNYIIIVLLVCFS